MLISFTCKKCDTRSTKMMSKRAYTKGVVIITCPGCHNRHLIADNLGYFFDNSRNIEDILKEKGDSIQRRSFNEGDFEILEKAVPNKDKE